MKRLLCRLGLHKEEAREFGAFVGIFCARCDNHLAGVRDAPQEIKDIQREVADLLREAGS